MNFTPIIRPLMMRRVEASRRWSAEVEATQRRVLAGLVERGRRTEWGSRHGFDTISCYEDFAGRVPVTPYPAIRAEVMRMVAGERDRSDTAPMQYSHCSSRFVFPIHERNFS